MGELKQNSYQTHESNNQTNPKIPENKEILKKKSNGMN